MFLAVFSVAKWSFFKCYVISLSNFKNEAIRHDLHLIALMHTTYNFILPKYKCSTEFMRKN